MGASKYKKARSGERSSGVVSAREAAAKAAQEKAKKTRALTIVGFVALALLIIAVVLINSTFLDTHLTAVTVDGVSYTAAEVRYAKQMAYNSFANNYSSLFSYLIDTSKPLSEQECMFNSELTWDEYFRDEGITYLRQTTALYNAAVAEDYLLSPEDAALIDSNMDMIAQSASSYGYTTDGFIAANYGEGNTARSVRRMMERSLIAAAYANDVQSSMSASLTEAQLDGYYAEHSDEYNTVRYLSATVPVEADADNGVTEEQARAAAQETVESIMALCDGTADSFSAAVLEQLGFTPTEGRNTFSGLGDNRDWFADESRQEGDVTMLEEGTGYRLYCYLSVDDNSYNTVSARHILIQVEDADDDGSYSDEEKAAALARLESVQAEWDGSEANFIELVEKYSEDSGSVDEGGLYENIYHGQMVSEFNDFVFSGAKKGDSAIVYGESSSYAGYHLIYFVGEGESYARVLSRSALSSEGFQKWEDELFGEGNITTGFMYRYI